MFKRPQQVRYKRGVALSLPSSQKITALCGIRSGPLGKLCLDMVHAFSYNGRDHTLPFGEALFL